MEFRIYVADLERYNSGYLVGKWYDLMEYDFVTDLQDDINAMLAENGNEEYAIHDYDCSFEHNFGEYESLDTFFDLKEFLEKNENLTLAIMELYGINQVANYFDKSYLINVEDYADLGHYVLEDVDYFELPRYLTYYFNYEEYGETYDINNEGGFTSYGYLQVIG